MYVTHAETQNTSNDWIYIVKNDTRRDMIWRHSRAGTLTNYNLSRWYKSRFICICMAYSNTAKYVTAGNRENCVAVQLRTSNFTPFFINIFSTCSDLYISMVIILGEIWTIVTISFWLHKSREHRGEVFSCIPYREPNILFYLANFQATSYLRSSVIVKWR